LLPQEAKETATTAAKTKANFFIFFLLFNTVKQSIVLKTGAKVRRFYETAKKNTCFFLIFF